MVNGRFAPDTAALEFAATKAILTRMQQILGSAEDTAILETVNAIFKTLEPLSLTYDLWECQNLYFRIGCARHADMIAKKSCGVDEACRWLLAFEELGTNLGVRCPH